VKAVVVDTGAWIALLSRNDQYAGAAAERYGILSAEGARLVTTNYIVDETATRLRYDAGLDAALAYRRMLDDSVQTRRLRIAWIDEPTEREAWRLLEQYRDVTLSLTDATTAVAARRARITEIFGLDRDFEALGLVVLPGSRRK
jgi:predicted nucleic acid-binding protein